MGRYSKKKRQKHHAQRRARERFGIYLTDNDVNEIIKMIQNASKKVLFVEKQSNRVSVFQVTYGDEVFGVVYDKIRKMIVTVLKKEWLKHEQKIVEIRDRPMRDLSGQVYEDFYEENQDSQTDSGT